MKTGKYNYENVADIMEFCVDSIIDDSSSEETVPTGFKVIDGFIGGLKKSRVILLSARPSVGKTALMLDMAWNAARLSGAQTVIYSLELSGSRIGEIYLNKETGIEVCRFRHAENITMEEIRRMRETVTQIREPELHLSVDDTPHRNLFEWVREVRTSWIRSHRVIFIDYIQLFEVPGVTDGKIRNRIILSELRKLADDMRITIVALSQITRRTGRRKPNVQDLLSPGITYRDLKDNVDVAMILHRDGWLGIGNGRDAKLILVHNRWGRRDVALNLRWDSEFCRFMDVDIEITSGEQCEKRINR